MKRGSLKGLKYYGETSGRPVDARDIVHMNQYIGHKGLKRRLGQEISLNGNSRKIGMPGNLGTFSGILEEHDDSFYIMQYTDTRGEKHPQPVVWNFASQSVIK